MSCQEKTRSSIKSLGLRMTGQREIVLEILHHTSKPVTAQMVLKAALSFDNSMDLTTVYRTLELFERFGLIVSYEAGHDSRRFLYTGGDKPRPRLICTQCGAVTELDPAALEIITGQSPHTTGWKVSINTAVLTGLCPVCRKHTQ